MNAMRPVRIVALALVAMAMAASSAEGREFDPLQEVWEYLSGRIILDTEDGVRMFEYCPDNTCDIFQGPEADDSRTILDFVFLYYVFVKSYNYPWMEEFRSGQDPDDVWRVLDRYSSGCRHGKGFVRCALISIADQGRIRVGFARYDEMTRHEALHDLSEVLDRALIPAMVEQYDVAR